MPELPRLDAPGFVVNWAARLFGRALDQRIASLGVTHGRWPVLQALYEEDGLTQTELAGRLSIEQPTMANTLKRMERDGLVRRAPDPDDRRRAHIHLTEEARHLETPLAACARAVNVCALEGLDSAEIAAFMAVLRRVVDNLMQDETSDERPARG